MAKKKEETVTGLVKITLSGTWKYPGTEHTMTVRLGAAGKWHGAKAIEQMKKELKEVYRRQLEEDGAPHPDAKLYMRATATVYECEHILG